MKKLILVLFLMGCGTNKMDNEIMIKEIKLCIENDLEPSQLRNISGEIYRVECKIKEN